MRWPLFAEVLDGTGGGGIPPETATSPPVVITPPGQAALPALDWREGLSQDYQHNPTVQKHSTLADFVKGAIEATSLIGRSIQIPAPEAPPEAWNGVWEKLGRPKSAAEYTDPTGVDLPEGWTLDAETTRALREEAYAAGFTQKHYETAIKVHAQWLREMTNQVQAAQAEAFHVGENTLAKQFGASAPRMKQAAQAAFEMLGSGVWGGEAGVRAWQKIRDAGLDNDADIVTAFSNQYEKMREGQYLVSDSYTAGVQSPQEFENQITTLLEKKLKDGRLSEKEEEHLNSLYQGKSRLRESGRLAR